jgi:hypothetical protein
LHLNLEHVKEATLVHFGIKILLNSQLKKQIMSLKLSATDMYDAVQTLFSFVSLDELSQLRSLTLLDLDIRTVSQLSSMLPLLTNLRHFRWTGAPYRSDAILTSLPTSTIQTLSIPTLTDDLSLKHPFTSLVNLTISRCFVKDLCHFFIHSPNLEYLNIEHFYTYHESIIDEPHLTNDSAIHLKQLAIHNFNNEFELLEILFKRTPNLKLLMICANDNIEIIDASRWQNLITTSLSHLDVFEFKFDFEFTNGHSDIVDKFQQFQSDFWHQQHHWYIEYAFKKYAALIYTVPYISNKYWVTPYTKRCYNKSINNARIFANVTDLTLCPEAITDNGEYYFQNVKSLRLVNGRLDENHTDPFLKTKHVQCLKAIVNLCNLIHLDILSECRLKSPSFMLQILKEAPYLSSLKINKSTLFSLFNNRELCKCLNKRIKKLDITGSSNYTFLDSNEIVKLCQIFSSMEEFWCNIGLLENLQLTLNELSKLSHMKAFVYETPYSESGERWLRNHVSELDLYSFTINCETDYYDHDDAMYDPFDSEIDYSDYDNH